MNSIPRKPIRHAKLRGLMHEKGLTQLDLQFLLGRSESYITSRMCGRSPWTAEEMYKVLDWLHISHDQLHIYFPPGGVS